MSTRGNVATLFLLCRHTLRFFSCTRDQVHFLVGTVAMREILPVHLAIFGLFNSHLPVLVIYNLYSMSRLGLCLLVVSFYFCCANGARA